MKNYVYVDYENLNNINELKNIPGKYIFFIGTNQTKLNSDLVVSSNNINVEWIKISGNGKNALDFHIVYYLSKYDNEEGVNHFILSRDTGFDPIIKHLKEKGIKIKRIITLDEILNNKTPKSKVAKSDYRICYDNLAKISKVKRPKTIKTLLTCFKSYLGKEKEKEVQLIVDQMFRNKFISLGSNNRLSYLK